MKYDVTGVTQEFLAGKIPERRDLIKDFHWEVVYNQVMKHFLAELGTIAMKEGYGPTALMGLALAHGMALGVLLEKDKERRLIV